MAAESDVHAYDLALREELGSGGIEELGSGGEKSLDQVTTDYVRRFVCRPKA